MRDGAAMTDIVERLREYNEPPFDYIAHEAAAKIEHLRLAWDTISVRWGITSAECNKLIIEIERLREALRSISNNTCCGNCQKAALVARAALKEKE